MYGRQELKATKISLQGNRPTFIRANSRFQRHNRPVNDQLSNENRFAKLKLTKNNVKSELNHVSGLVDGLNANERVGLVKQSATFVSRDQEGIIVGKR